MKTVNYGMLRGGQASTPSANGTEGSRPQEPDDKPPDQSTADKRGSKSVARNVAHFSVSERLSASLDVTEHDKKEEAEGPQEVKCASPQSQKATGDNSSCRLVSQKKKSGEGEIRTPGPLRDAGFQDRCNRPLCHLSGPQTGQYFLRRSDCY